MNNAQISIKNSGSLLRPIASLGGVAFVALTCASIPSALADPGNDNRAPDVPAAIQVPDGNKVSFHANAVGVQIYAATPSTTSPSGFAWTFKAPEAVLFDNDGNVVGMHYAGPTRESESGSKVVGVRTNSVAVPNAIPWLLLVAKTTEGPGIFADTTYVQRVNTTGGLAPATAPTQADQEAPVPYTAEYFFFRASQQ